MEALGIAGGQLDQWRPDHWLLMLEIVMLLAMMAANSRATMLVYASDAGRRSKRFWLAAIWGLPFMGVFYLLRRGVRSAIRPAQGPQAEAQVDNTR